MMDKGVAPYSPSTRYVVVPVGIKAQRWPHGSAYEAEILCKGPSGGIDVSITS